MIKLTLTTCELLGVSFTPLQFDSLLSVNPQKTSKQKLSLTDGGGNREHEAASPAERGFGILLLVCRTESCQSLWCPLGAGDKDLDTQ